MKAVAQPDFWENPELLHLRRNMNAYKQYLSNMKVYRQDKDVGDYFIAKADLTTQNEDDMFFAVLNNVIRPFVLYRIQGLRAK